ncbi:putative hydrophobic protein (TIGR00341 family) [Pontibacter ummariensis]|uniref:TIGR00341 family protein n=1 Tax=Pontibacter ummariensis TaxID=1610492 RepID=A0A239FC41_9BACT|nr:TIGR00341 family protein [Pontibacter ummariensis]PRY12322.1 putative hydrophobic protein (TIGR00341 family) [Pontibacter ummariensis]SNS54486.1 TIGR00341 family protein [Pontibacter ummariensis]
MRTLTLIYDPLEEQTVREKILPAFQSFTITPIAFDLTKETIVADSRLITYLSDESLAEIVMLATNKNCSLSLLPHPMMKEARVGYGIAANLSEAIEDIERAAKSVTTDLLLCNGRPVFNKVVIGESLSLIAGSVAKNSFFSAFEKIGRALARSGSYIPQAFTITTDHNPPLKTAALGIIGVLHGKNNLLSRLLIKDSYINDARMHSLILAPKSVMQLIRFYLRSVIDNKKGKLPSFVGHIKAKSIVIESPAPIDYAQDNNLLSAKAIELRVLAGAFRIVPGRYLSAEVQAGEPAEVYRVNNLPKGEEYLHEIVAKPLSWIYHASTEEFKDLFVTLRENAKATGPYLTLMVLSTLLATLGLFSDSSPVIIGAMILAPLMAPIISMSMGVLRQEKKLISGSAKTIALGLFLSYLAAVLLTLLMPLQALNPEISSRIRPNLLDLGVAIFSGVAGAYAHARKEVAKTLAGVAIAVALVPPLSVSGIGIGWADWEVFSGALLLFTTNLAGIILAAAFTFMLLGFSPFRLARKGLLISLLVVILISLPLGLGFLKMVRENNVMRSLNNYAVEDITVREVTVIKGGDPMLLNVRLVSGNPISNADLAKVKREIASKIGRDVQLEVTISMKR